MGDWITFIHLGITTYLIIEVIRLNMWMNKLLGILKDDFRTFSKALQFVAHNSGLEVVRHGEGVLEIRKKDE